MAGRIDADARRALIRALAALVAPLAGGDASIDVPSVADWPRLIGLASRHGLAPAVGAVHAGRAIMPDPVRDYFEAALWLNGERNQMIRQGLGRTLDALAAADVRPLLLLKGAAALAADLYPDPAIRVLGDIDLLVPAGSAATAVAALESAGFGHPDIPALPAGHHHLPMLVDAESGAGVELHVEPLAVHARLLTAVDMFAAAEAVSVQGRPALIGGIADRIVHVLAHDQIGDGGFRRHVLSLRQLLEFARLAGIGGAAAWPDVARRFEQAGALAVLHDAQGLALGLFRAVTPGATMVMADAALARMDAALSRRRPGMAPVLGGLARRIGDRPSLIAGLLDPRRFRRRWRDLQRTLEPQDW